MPPSLCLEQDVARCKHEANASFEVLADARTPGGGEGGLDFWSCSRGGVAWRG